MEERAGVGRAGAPRRRLPWAEVVRDDEAECVERDQATQDGDSR